MGRGLSFFLYEHVLLYESKQVAPSAVAMAAVLVEDELVTVARHLALDDASPAGHAGAITLLAQVDVEDHLVGIELLDPLAVHLDHAQCLAVEEEAERDEDGPDVPQRAYAEEASLAGEVAVVDEERSRQHHGGPRLDEQDVRLLRPEHRSVHVHEQREELDQKVAGQSATDAAGDHVDDPAPRRLGRRLGDVAPVGVAVDDALEPLPASVVAVRHAVDLVHTKSRAPLWWDGKLVEGERVNLSCVGGGVVWVGVVVGTVGG
eukprot:scaffold64590_cov61-Phaeocystis_antarctica.AAC.8